MKIRKPVSQKHELHERLKEKEFYVGIPRCLGKYILNVYAEPDYFGEQFGSIGVRPDYVADVVVGFKPDELVKQTAPSLPIKAAARSY
jgi:hypothetical protein